MKNNTIRTRLAPSPTGMFHIGTARTALFNYLFAKHAGGKFLLRFEDTDKVRSKKEYEKDIIDGLEWLGLKWDTFKFPISNFQFPNKSQISNNKSQTFYRQSEHLDLYQKYVDQLLKEDKAYKKDGAIWFKIRQQTTDNRRQIEFTDLIHGKIEFDIDEFNDFVIIKSDGNPSFMFSNTVDDHEMGITHVIRGDDHLTNTPQQILIYQTFGWEIPQFAHMPMILNKDRSKMSKRKDQVSVSRDFRDQGYLPQALINYMAFLGWNPKDNREFFTLKDLEKEFDLSKVNKSGAVFDIDKFNYFNNYYIKTSSFDKLMKLISNFQFPISNKSPNSKFQIINKDKNLIKRIITIVKERMQKLTDFDELSSFFFEIPEYKSETLVFKKSDKAKTLKGLHVTRYTLQDSPSSEWDKTESLNQILLNVVNAEGLSNGDVFWPVRVALSGLDRSPSPPEILWVLGKDESIKRIKLAINKFTKRKDNR